MTLDSPHNRNALTMALIGEMTARTGAAAADPSVRAVVLTHTGRVVGTIRIPLEVSGHTGSGRLVEAEGFALVSAAAGATESGLASSPGIDVRAAGVRLRSGHWG